MAHKLISIHQNSFFTQIETEISLLNPLNENKKKER